jgi:small subunit ribosomal protein S1
MGEVNPTMLNPDDDDFELDDTETSPEDSEAETEDESAENRSTEPSGSSGDQTSDDVTIEDGAILEGTVMKIDDREALVDFGWQSEGLLPYDQAADKSLDEGDEITVKILTLNPDNDEELPRLSQKAALADRAWKKVKESFEAESVIEGTIFKKIKGGFLVNLFKGLTAFMPMSHLSDSKVDDHEEYLDETYEMKILEHDREDENVVVSRRAYLEDKQAQEEASFFSNNEEGDWVEGEVKNIVNFGAFVDLGPVDGLLHVSDMAWGEVRDPKNQVSESDTVEVQILDLDRSESKVSLGLKQKYPDPWDDIDSDYEEGQVTTGEISDVWDDGVFVRLEEDVEGKIDESELSWIQSWQHPGDQFHEGEKIEVKIIDIDQERRAISLSHKRTTNNPWDILQERFPEGTVLKAPVVDIQKDHLNVQLLENVEGIIRKENISWEHDDVDLYENFTLNDKIKCKILELSPDRQRVELGVKQTTPDPWVQKAREYPTGTTLEGTVTNVLQFGAFVEIEDGLEGLVHVSEMTESKRVNPHEVVSEGDTVGVKVMDVDEDEHKVDLSIQAYEKEQQREEMEEYIDDESDDEDEMTMGDMLGDELDDIMKD